MSTNLENLKGKVMDALLGLIQHGHGKMTIEVSTLGDRRVNAVIQAGKSYRFVFGQDDQIQ